MQTTTRVLWNDGGAKGLYGEDGATEFVSRRERKVEEAKRSFERALEYGLTFLLALQGRGDIRRRLLQER